MPVDKSANTEREHTDESLRAERKRADDVLEKISLVEETADEVIERARARADEVLATSRAKVDRALRDGRAHENTPDKLAHERRLEDRVLHEERAEADQAREAERAEHASLLTNEREVTDKDLLLERSRADENVATRDEFLGIVSHDLRNMLGAVIGFASLIAKAESGETEHRAEQIILHARRIQRSVARMNRLVGDLVDVASIETGALAISPHPADPGRVVAEVVETFRDQAAAHGITLTADVVVPPSRVPFDPARLLQVLANLVGNAIKFTPLGGTVTVRVERTGDDLLFAVRDTGVGISADQLETVFERFRQLETGDRRGVGLGLYISRCIVQGHGGRIWAESRPGSGSTFRFTIPARGAN